MRRKLTGVCAPAQGAVLAEVIGKDPASVWLVIAQDLKAADRLAEDIALFRTAASQPQASILVFPESIPDTRDMREAFAASSDRLTVLSQLRERRDRPHPVPLIAVTTPSALLQQLPALAQFAAKELVLEKGQRQPFQELLEKLAALDYDHEAVCEAPGHYAVRGGIVDVYPVTATEPYRLDFFGDDIEEIRAFDPVTQRSAATVTRISVPASPRVALDPAKTGIADYLPKDARIALVEPASLAQESNALAEDDRPQGLHPLLSRVAGLYGISDLDEANDLLDETQEEGVWETESLSHVRAYPEESLMAQDRLHAEEDSRKRFLDTASGWAKHGTSLYIVASKAGEEARIREILEEHGGFKGKAMHFLKGALNEGFRITHRKEASTERLSLAPKSAGVAVITETEIFGRQRARRITGTTRAVAGRAQVDQLLDFSELVEGDFVVHLQHGIALFRGLTTLDTAQGTREVISLEFDDSVTLHVPLQESHLISRYVGLGKTRPQLGRIGSNRWEKTRQAAERATIDLAAELLQIQAKREAQPGHAYPPDNLWQKEFEGSFPFTETRDQLTAIESTKTDMEKTRPMDRLICGDVGFGKTEVAIRAAFKAVQGGRQVAVLVPTTVLAQQHLNSFRERMAGYPVAVEMLSRFRTRPEQKTILAAVAAGQIDILIGTHRLLQTDVVFKELGLVVVDEEQRFGVKHKERLKQMRSTVDVLSMSATPIPRTLYLAMTGARDLSVIETAPANRHPIQTIVKTYDEKVVIDAIRYEIRRGGQVFYLHNRVATIELVAAKMREWMPELRIGVGHGQMDADELEKAMTDFVAGSYHVLVCTTIIESGLDLPNCNTIIIEGADRFGLSQLYQLRGRVGRFKHQAYAYLLLHRHARILDIARQRLTALRQHNQLGAGFRIAMRDLELRGAGNLLGSQQSGHIVGVGFELYCQLLRQSVSRLKGEKTAAAIRASVKLDFVFVGEGVFDEESGKGRRVDGYTALKDAEDAAAVPVAMIQARIPTPYVSETRLRIDFYRRLAMADSPKALKEIENDFRDRFGKFGDDVRALLLITEIRVRAEQKGIVSVETESTRLKCLRNSGRRDDWVMIGTRFPRLTAPKPLLRLREILSFLNNLPSP